MERMGWLDMRASCNTPPQPVGKLLHSQNDHENRQDDGGGLRVLEQLEGASSNLSHRNDVRPAAYAAKTCMSRCLK